MTRWLLRLALLAYPAAFRRRFGDELLAALLAETTHVRPGRVVVRTVASGLAERGLALGQGLRDRSSPFPHVHADARRPRAMTEIVRADVRHALRLAARTPLATALTVLALGLGIGATSAVATVVHRVLIAPLPYADPDRLVVVWSDAAAQGRPRNTVSPADYRDLAAGTRTLAGLDAYFSFVTPVEIAIDGPTEVAIGVTVTPGLFPLLGRAPALGHAFAEGDAPPPEILISHQYWQRRFGGDAGVVGRAVRLGPIAATVAGVMPEDFVFPYGTMLGPSGFTRVTTVDLWMPMAFQGPLATVNRMLTPQGQVVRSVRWLGTIGRMRPGVSPDDVQAEMTTLTRQLAAAYPDTNAGWGATVVPIAEQTVGGVRPAMMVLLAGVAVVLIIAAVNVANLVLARSLARRRELATRVALGAGRRRLVQQAITEGLLLASAGGLAGVLLARLGVRALVALAPPELPRLGEVGPDLTLLLAAGCATLATGVLVGVLPAAFAARTDPHAVLQEHGRGSGGGPASRRVRAGLVIAELALAVMLATGAGLLLRSFVSLLGVDPGFRSEQLLTWQMTLPERLRADEARTAFYDEFLARLRALPGVTGAGGTTRLPLGSTGVTTSLEVEGRPVPEAQWPEVQFRRAIGDYFTVMGIPLLRGRSFADGDGPSAPRVCVINQTLAATLFPGEDPLGRRVRNGTTQPWITIVGVIGDIRHGALEETPQPELYVSHRQGTVVNPYMVVRTSGDPAALGDLIRAEARAIDPALPIYQMDTMSAVRSASVAQRRFLLVLVGAFGLLALTLSAIGVYGVMSLAVAERTQELGVRLALGAQPRQLLRLVLGEAVGLAAIGITLGLAVAAPLAPLLRSQLFGVSTTDPLTLIGVTALLVCLAAVAAVAPARRAMRVEPAEALR